VKTSLVGMAGAVCEFCGKSAEEVGTGLSLKTALILAGAVLFVLLLLLGSAADNYWGVGELPGDGEQ
jgi:hypothetical protein